MTGVRPPHPRVTGKSIYLQLTVPDEDGHEHDDFCEAAVHDLVAADPDRSPKDATARALAVLLDVLDLHLLRAVVRPSGKCRVQAINYL